MPPSRGIVTPVAEPAAIERGNAAQVFPKGSR
jgi:hypothetical protein